MYSDASDTGYGGYCLQIPGGIAHGMWTRQESLESSTWRELTAVVRVLKSILHIIRGHRIKWFTDYQAVISIVQRGSKELKLHVIAKEIFLILLKNQTSLETEWIPWLENDRADFLSGIIDFDDRGLAQFVFDRLWGPHHIDWFASSHKAKLDKFYYRFWNPGSNGVDAFTENWSEFGRDWFLSTFHLIERVIRHLRFCKGFGTLVVPFWHSGRFWPLLCPDGKLFIREDE